MKIKRGWVRRSGVGVGGIALSAALAACSGAADGPGAVREVTGAVCAATPPPPLADISKAVAGGAIHYRFVGTTDNNCVEPNPSCVTAQTCSCLKNQIRSAMKDWETKTGTLKFTEDTSNPLAYAINIDPPGCQANNQTTGCNFRHEVGHLIGLAHEQQRLDANRFLTLNPADDVCDDYSENTRYVDTIWSGTNFGVYDETSTMHYNPVIGNDSTYDFTRKNGTVNGLGFQYVAGQTAGSTIQPGDVNSVYEHEAKTSGWDRFRSRGTATSSSGPLVTQLATGIVLQTGKPIAAAQIRRVDLALVYGSNGHVYVSSRGTQSSSWSSLFSSSTASAATTVGSEFAVANATSSGISVQLSSNASSQIAAHPDGALTYNWSTAVSWGSPGSSPVSGLAIASLGASKLALVARLDNGDLWMRQTTNLSSVNGLWSLITTGVTGRPAMAAFNGELRVYHAHKVSAFLTTLRESRCTGVCNTATDVGGVLPSSTPAVAASQTELHLLFKDTSGRLNWRRQDTAGAFSIIGSLLAADPAVTNAFEDRFGSYAAFAELNDHSLWQKNYNRYFRGRLGNLPINDFDRDAKTDPVIVRNGVWWILPSSGMPGASLSIASTASNDVLLPAADYNGDGVSEPHVYHRSSGTWSSVNVDRFAPAVISSNTVLPNVQFGVSTDRPVPGDYDGDLITDEAVFRPSDGNWYASLSGGGSDMVLPFGGSADVQVPADYDGDGKTDAALFRPSIATWFVHPSGGGGDIVLQFGQATDRLVPGDYDGDGRADFAYFRPATGHWTIHFQTGEPDADIPFGVSTDRVTPGDFDGDGATDLALFRGSEGNWYIHPSSGGGDLVRHWGEPTDRLPWPGG